MIKEFFKYLPGIISAILAAYFTARWSLRKLYSEKWWERKEKAYSEIVEALYQVMQYCEIKKDHYEVGKTYSDEKMKEFQDRYSMAYWKLKKATDIGAFVISQEGAKVLEELRSRPKLDWNENPPWEIYDQDYEYYKKALENIVRVAKKDLKATKA
ncbi:MAG: hypothetical protein JRJ38_16705 [Deltaproteobacteria bacterium]|nr:hypothetical protein [Deltaproteobacteria bacterium]